MVALSILDNFRGFWGIVYLVLLVFVLYLILTSKYTLLTKVIWILIVVLLPVLGCIGFLVWRYVLKK